MDLNNIFKSSDALKCEDLHGRDVVLTIKFVEIGEFTDSGRKSQKPVLSFNETEKTFVTNKTNSMMIGEHHGYDTDGWPGKQITMYPTRTDFGGKMVDCIRIRPPVQSTQPATQGLPNPTHPNAPGALNDDIPF